MIIQKIRTFLKYQIYAFLYKDRSVLPFEKKEIKFVNLIGSKGRINLDFKKNIWMYWDGNLVPYIVQKCVQRVKDLHPNFDVHFLNNENLNEFLPDFKISNVDMPLANKSDLIRLELLYKYGGIWLDATVILNESLNWVVDKMNDTIYDCIGFAKLSNTIDFNYPVIESWFLCSPPFNVFIKNWLDELRPLGMLGANEYFNTIKNRTDYDDIRQNIEKPKYLLVYLSQQIAMRKDDNFNICYQIAEETAFYYQEKLSWNFKKINFEFILKNTKFDVPPVIKLISHNFSDIDYCYVNGFINEKSLIGKLFKSP